MRPASPRPERASSPRVRLARRSSSAAPSSAPGDFVVADESGVVVVESHAVADVSSRARARTEKERGIFEGLRLGRTTLELLGLPAD